MTSRVSFSIYAKKYVWWTINFRYINVHEQWTVLSVINTYMWEQCDRMCAISTSLKCILLFNNSSWTGVLLSTLFTNFLIINKDSNLIWGNVWTICWPNWSLILQIYHARKLRFVKRKASWWIANTITFHNRKTETIPKTICFFWYLFEQHIHNNWLCLRY